MIKKDPTTEPNLHSERFNAGHVREQLKRLLESELEQLPETLAAMEPKDRLAAVIKLMPFVFPRIDAVHYREGEPLTHYIP